MKTFMSRAVLASLLLGASMMASAATPAPAGAKAFIVTPENGATVDKTFKVKFGIEGVALAPAGDATKNTGHHHLLIDTGPIAAGQVIPADAQHVHFGKAQTETELTLTPGTHTLQLELGDKNHMAFEPPIISEKITVTVK
ncbi:MULTISPECIES: DUF4399 domain-containing protein [unclassified Pseudomonas]|jgi:hypothetical protein|uniref:DUF4399 domain-containing protein n=1 Tax=unclassified Pseudomonas TaxID=196821 RepID=UPI000BA4ACE2|nr:MULTISPECIES: DUF4399 domain-containing protein [unclassified Pseudomonas]QHD03742.1 ATPase [Pseudomonas sp. S04]QHF36227.1 ATPase [Pseudomonas sp. S19]